MPEELFAGGLNHQEKKYLNFIVGFVFLSYGCIYSGFSHQKSGTELSVLHVCLGLGAFKPAQLSLSVSWC